VFLTVLSLSIQTVKASETIYIRADGSIDPSTEPISSMDNVTYTFTGNINNSIVVERSHIIIDGNKYTLQGSGLGKGFDLSGVNNVTIKNTNLGTLENGREINPNYGIHLNSSSSNTISGNNITNNYYSGIYLEESSHNTIVGNNITNNYHGIWLQYSSNNTIVGNNVTNSDFSLPFPPIPTRTHGIELAFSSSNLLRNNVMADSDFNFGVLGGALSDFVNDVDTSNSVDGKPMYYWISRRDIDVPSDAGYVALVNCTNVRIENLTLTKNMQGILLAYTNYTTIVGNNITNNWNGILLWYSSNYNDVFGNNVTANNGVGISFAMCANNTASGNNIADTDNFGIYLEESSNNSISGHKITDNRFGIYVKYSSNNTIVGNDVTNNEYGLGIWISSDNLVYHNDLVNIAGQVYTANSVNVWHDSVEGNYWNDYSGVDTSHDGIGDTPYIIDENNKDNYPLMGMFCSFNTSLGKHVNVVSNSTIEDFEYFESNNTIKMHVTGLEGIGFCRVCFPKLLFCPHCLPYITAVINDGLTPVLYDNYTLHENATHKWIYFAYEHSTHEINIIPEFPSFLILPLFMIATLLAVIVYRRKYTR